MKTYTVKRDNITLMLYDKNGIPILTLEDVRGDIDMDKKGIRVNVCTDSDQLRKLKLNER